MRVIFKEAAAVTRRHSRSRDLRWSLIRSELDRANGRRQAALKRLAKLTESAEVGEQAVSQILRIAAESGSGQGISALHSARCRTGIEMTSIGRPLAIGMRVSGTGQRPLEMWGHVSDRNASLSQSMSAACLHHLASLCETAQFELLMEEIKNGTLSAVDVSSRLLLATATLMRWSSAKVEKGEVGIEQVAAMLDDVTEYLPALAEQPETQRLMGVIQCLRGRMG